MDWYIYSLLFVLTYESKYSRVGWHKNFSTSLANIRLDSNDLADIFECSDIYKLNNNLPLYYILYIRVVTKLIWLVNSQHNLIY